jgi:hypothetical protein
MAKRSKVKPPDTGEAARWRSAQRTTQSDISKIKSSMPRDVSTDVNLLKSDLCRESTFRKNFEIGLKDGLDALSGKVQTTELSLTRLRGEVRDTDRSTKVDMDALKADLGRANSKIIALQTSTDVETTRLDNHIADADQRRVLLQTKVDSVGLAMDGNTHLYAAQHVIEVSKALLDANGHTETVGVSLVAETESTQEFTAGTDDVCTATAHGLVDEQKVRLRSSDTLPAPLAAGTVYYVIYIDADTFKLTTDVPGTASPTPVDITDTGTGTHVVDAVTARSDHQWCNKLLSLSTAKTVTPDFGVDEISPDSGHVQWDLSPTTRPHLSSGTCLFRFVFADGPYELAGTMTTTIKVNSDSKLMGNTVTDLDLVFKVVT